MSFQEVFHRYAPACIPWNGYAPELYEAVLAGPQIAADFALSYLDKALQDPNVASIEDDDYNMIMCALAISTGLMDQRAFPLVLRFAQHDLANNLLNDYVTELYPDMIARTYKGDLESLVSTITDEHTDQFLNLGQVGGLIGLGQYRVLEGAVQLWPYAIQVSLQGIRLRASVGVQGNADGTFLSMVQILSVHERSAGRNGKGSSKNKGDTLFHDFLLLMNVIMMILIIMAKQ